MGPILSAMLGLQAIERDLAQLRRRMRARQNAVNAQEARIAKHQEEQETLRASRMDRRKQADQLEVDLKQREDHIAKLRTALNTAKTNKEYASILTQINSDRADNAKIEEQTIQILGDVDTLKAQEDEIQAQVDAEQKRLEEIQASHAEELERLQKMIDELQAKRAEATKDISPENLSLFERIAEKYDGEAMAQVEVSGKKPPFTYSCGGCFMGLNAEHANALQTRDEIRQCDNCSRILYIKDTPGR